MNEDHPNMGSSLEDLLKEEGIYEEVKQAAIDKLNSLIADEIKNNNN